MQSPRKLCVALAALAALAWLPAAGTAEPVPPAVTTITVAKMHCGGCAKKIANKLRGVAGVAGVRTDVKAATATVAAQAGHAPSPRALWEAVEKAGHKPVRLDGPAGTFTAKPQS